MGGANILKMDTERVTSRLRHFFSSEGGGAKAKTLTGAISLVLLVMLEVYFLNGVGQHNPHLPHPERWNDTVIMPLSTCSLSIPILGGPQNLKLSTCTSLDGKIVDIRQFTNSENLPGPRGVALNLEQWQSLVKLDHVVKKYLKDNEPKIVALP